MTLLKDLSSEQIKIVHEWLRAMGMPVNRKIDRDYSDGVLVAKLLKKLYPRLVELQGYHPRVNHDLKVINWQMLQFKVFNRIGLPLSYSQIYDLAKGEAGLLEPLLWEVMALERKKIPPPKKRTLVVKKKSVEMDTIQVPPKQVREIKRPKTEPIKSKRKEEMFTIAKERNIMSSKFANPKRNPDKIVDLSEQGMIPFAVYEDVISEVRAKENTIKAFKTKVSILERLIKERDMEINSLRAKGHFVL